MKNKPSFTNQNLEKIENSTKDNPEEMVYCFSMKPDIHNLLYIGLIFLGILVLFFLVIGKNEIFPPQLKILLILCIVFITVGILFWKVEKKFIFSRKTGILTLKTIRFKISLCSKTFLIKDCVNFDIQFLPRKNASFLVLQPNLRKPYRIQFKRNNDEINLHLVNLNQILSSIKQSYFPSSFTEKTSNINEDIIADDTKRKITRDIDHNIVVSHNFLLFVSPVLFFLPLMLVYVSYLFLGTKTSIGNSSPIIVIPVILIALDYIAVVYFLFYTLRVKDLELKRDHDILTGDRLFTPPKFLQNFLSNLKASYIKPEQVSFYRKLRTGFILEGFIPIITSFVFLFLSFF